jgi:hypothetical protein
MSHDQVVPNVEEEVLLQDVLLIVLVAHPLEEAYDQ